MLAHLTEDGANVKMDVGGVQDLEAVVHALLAVVQVVVFDLEGLLQEAEG